MSRLRGRKASFELGADMAEILRDNTTARTRTAVADAEGEKPEATGAPPKARGRKSTPKPELESSTSSKPATPRVAPAPSPAAQRGETGAVSIVVPVIDGRMVSDAKALAAETGLPLTKTVAPEIRVAMGALRADLLSGAALKLDVGYRRPDPVYTFRSSIYLTGQEIERIRQVVDPHGLLSRTKAVSLAVAMYLEAARKE